MGKCPPYQAMKMDGDQPLGIKDLAGIYIILLVGLILAVVVRLVEFMLRHNKAKTDHDIEKITTKL